MAAVIHTGPFGTGSEIKKRSGKKENERLRQNILTGCPKE